MRLLILAPHVATRDCGDCLRHVYDEKTGKRVMRRDKPVPRIPQAPAPCRTPAGCPKGAPVGEPGCKELSPKNWLAYRHYQECRAVGDFPRDATVRRNASLIRMAEESATEAAKVRALGPLAVLLGKGGK